MSEFEIWLADQLHQAAPRSMDPSALVAGTHRYLRRARRMRVVATAAVMIAVIAVGGAVVSGSFHDRALPPARPVSHLLCREHPGAEPASIPSNSRPWSQLLREVLVCADRSDKSVWQGFLPPDEPVSAPGDLDYLSLETTTKQHCRRMPSGPSYRFLLLDATGQVSAVDNRRLACNGWPALNRYFIALGDQMSAERHLQLPDPFPPCPSMLHTTMHPSASPSAALRKGTVFTAATLCWHPLADPQAEPAKEPQVVGRQVLSVRQLATLNAEIRRHGSTRGPVTCRTDPQWVVVLNAVTTTGQPISLTGPCADSDQLFVNDAQDDTIRFPRSVVEALTK